MGIESGLRRKRTAPPSQRVSKIVTGTESKRLFSTRLDDQVCYLRMANSFTFSISKKMVDATVTSLAAGNVELIALGDTLSGGSRRAFLRCSGWTPPLEMRDPDIVDERVWR